jgi:hypothetical protein
MSIKNNTLWYMILMVTYIVSYIIAYQLAVYFVRQEVIYWIPVTYFLILMLGILIALKGKLFSKTYKLRYVTIAMISLSGIIWLFTLYALLEVLSPSVF